MLRRARALVIGIVLVIGAVGAAEAAAVHAEEPAAPADSITAPGGVTLEQAARAALRHYQPFLISRETVTQLVQQRRQALSALLPTLTLNADTTQRRDSLLKGGNVIRAKENWGYNLTLSQPLFAGGKGVSGLRSATAQLEAGKQSLNQSREEVLLTVAQAYYGVLKAHKQVEVFDAERKRLEEHRRSAEAQVKVGQVTKTVLLRAQAEYAGAAAGLIRAEADEATARDQLAQITGLPADMALSVPPVPAPPSMESDALIADAETARPELLRSRFSERAAQQNVRLAASGLFPTLSLNLAYDKSAQNPESNFAVEDDADKFAQLQLSFPLFEGGLQIAKIQEARARWRSAVLDTQLVKETVDTEVRNALRDVKALAGSVEQFTAQVAFANENYELTERQFAVGLATNIDVMDANSTLLSAEQELAAATFDHDLAVLRLYKSLGRLTAQLLGR